MHESRAGTFRDQDEPRPSRIRGLVRRSCELRELPLSSFRHVVESPALPPHPAFWRSRPPSGSEALLFLTASLFRDASEHRLLGALEAGVDRGRRDVERISMTGRRE